MEKFIAQQNIEHFVKLIEREPDLAKRERLTQMLAEQRAKLSGAETGSIVGKAQPCAASRHTQPLPGLRR
jgi:hypothetical protein